MKRLPLLVVAVSLFQQISCQFYCADLLQQCAKSAAEYTEQILQHKENAFKACVRRPSCHTERRIFDECFDASVSATHVTSSPQETTSNDGETSRVTHPPMVKYNTMLKFFAENSLKFRSALDQCFVRSPFVPKRSFFGPSILDEDAAYARAVYQFDLADRLWGLPELSITRPSLDTLGVCGTLNRELRVFGSGISRIARASDPTKNNITSACMLDENEIACYRQALDLNSEYVQLIYNRDYALRGCIHNIRQQSVCRMNDRSRLRACLCGVREQYDSDVQAGILQCVKSNSPHVPSMVIEMSSSLDREPSISKVQEQIVASQLTFDTPGAIINGQCMCACENSVKQEVFRTFQQKNNKEHGRTQTQKEQNDAKNDGDVEEEMISMEAVKDEEPPKTNAARFKENSPRLMQPSEAAGKVFWMNNITII